jgi:hypothetical protein
MKAKAPRRDLKPPISKAPGRPTSRVSFAGSPHIFIAFALVILILLAYSNSFTAGFALDNKGLLNSPRLTAFTTHNLALILDHSNWWPNGESGLYRPFTTFTYAALSHALRRVSSLERFGQGHRRRSRRVAFVRAQRRRVYADRDRVHAQEPHERCYDRAHRRPPAHLRLGLAQAFASISRDAPDSAHCEVTQTPTGETIDPQCAPFRQRVCQLAPGVLKVRIAVGRPDLAEAQRREFQRKYACPLP